MSKKAYIKEIFTSIQGEGPYIGDLQTFVRFCDCNLACKYCDTKFRKDKNTTEYSSKELAQILLHDEVNTVSLTGGEPLMELLFLHEFLPLIKKQKKIYLETNGTLANELASVIEYVDIVAADIKLESATKQENQFEMNEQFISIASKKECFIKIVFDDKIQKDEIAQVVRIAKKYSIPLILQPAMNKFNIMLDSKKMMDIYKIFYALYPNTRLIPQVHKFLKVL